MKDVRRIYIFTPVESRACMMDLILEDKSMGSSFFNSRLKSFTSDCMSSNYDYE
jgi:hypothetical protein